MDDEQIMRSLIMRFSYSLIVIAVWFVGGVAIELMAQGARWLGVSDFTYYIMSGAAYLIFLTDAFLLVFTVVYTARRFLKEVFNEH